MWLEIVFLSEDSFSPIPFSSLAAERSRPFLTDGCAFTNFWRPMSSAGALCPRPFPVVDRAHSAWNLYFTFLLPLPLTQRQKHSFERNQHGFNAACTNCGTRMSTCARMLRRKRRLCLWLCCVVSEQHGEAFTAFFGSAFYATHVSRLNIKGLVIAVVILVFRPFRGIFVYILPYSHVFIFVSHNMVMIPALPDCIPDLLRCHNL